MRDTIYDPDHARLNLEDLPEEFQNLGKALIYYTSCVEEVTALAKALSRGELNGPLPSRNNELASPLKSLHATLKHLTWQAQQVAKGDYQQRVSFMGDFSASFNTMIEQLERHRAVLLKEVENSQKQTKALEKINSLFKAITSQMSQWIIVVDENTMEWLYLNHEPAHILADPTSEPQLRSWLEQQIISARLISEAEINTDLSIEGTNTAELELSHGGQTQYLSATFHPLRWRDHDAFAFVLTDTSSEKDNLHRLQNVAYCDALTGIPNRHRGLEVLNKWLACKKNFIMAFADIDGLKQVNDVFGHVEGDLYIQHVAEMLQQFSPDAFLCRLGGDEFMLLVDSFDLTAARERLETLRLRMSQQDNGRPYLRDVSYGVIEVKPDNTLTTSELLHLSDQQMYRHKRRHKASR